MTSVAKRHAAVAARIQELHDEKGSNEAEMARIKMQLEEARGLVGQTGEYSDPRWYARASYALRMRGRKAQQIQLKIGELGRLLRKLNAAQVERCFIDAARRELEREEFQRLWAVAEQLSIDRAGREEEYDLAEASGPNSGDVRMVQVTRARPADARRA